MKILFIIFILSAFFTFFASCTAWANQPAISATGENGTPRLTEKQQKTLDSVRKLSDYDDLNIYSMEIFYDYNLDNLTPVGVYDTQKLMDLAFSEALPGVSVDYTVPQYGCSAFTLKGDDGTFRMGRNYDFAFDSSVMIVRCHPKDGYASVAHTALDNIKTNDPFVSPSAKIACLVSPFMCIDGVNEKGVGIAVLTLDSKPTEQRSGKPVLCTTVLIRLVLDKAATTKEAVELLSKYDVYAICGRDYHFYITDVSGDGRVVEFDCGSKTRETIVTPSRSVTNFYIKYKDKVLPNQKNGIYGHGRERYDKIEAVFDKHNGKGDNNVAWEALKAASQLPSKGNITSNTQWSAVYNLNDLNYEFVLHRRWNDVRKFSVK